MECWIKLRHKSKFVSKPFRVRYTSLPRVGDYIMLCYPDLSSDFFYANEEISTKEMLLFIDNSHEEYFLSLDDKMGLAHTKEQYGQWKLLDKEYDNAFISALNSVLPKYCKVCEMYYESYDSYESGEDCYPNLIPVIVLEKDEEWYEQHK